MRKIILASGSPRRKELLTKMRLVFAVVPSDFTEWLDDTRSPENMAVELARGKAASVAERFPEAIIIGSDTIVTVEGKQLGKAENVDEARNMWRIATSAPNKITTSVVVMCKAEGYEFATSDNAYVTFKPYDSEAVESYLATTDWHDKAGAWSIQKCRNLMETITGDEETILGLPTRLLTEPLQHVTNN